MDANNKAVSARMSDFEVPSKFISQVSFKENNALPTNTNETTHGLASRTINNDLYDPNAQSSLTPQVLMQQDHFNWGNSGRHGQKSTDSLPLSRGGTAPVQQMRENRIIQTSQQTLEGTKPGSNDQLVQIDNYYQELLKKERDETHKVLLAKLACQRTDLERKWSTYFKKAEATNKKNRDLEEKLKIARATLKRV